MLGLFELNIFFHGKFFRVVRFCLGDVSFMWWYAAQSQQRRTCVLVTRRSPRPTNFRRHAADRSSNVTVKINIHKRRAALRSQPSADSLRATPNLLSTAARFCGAAKRDIV